jgi:hypothetical protein
MLLSGFNLGWRPAIGKLRNARAIQRRVEFFDVTLRAAPALKRRHETGKPRPSHPHRHIQETIMNAPTSFATLPSRPFGLTGMSITRVGFGAWAIGGPDWAVGWGAQDDRESVIAIRHAIDRGVNWIDTAAIYGLGHSEEIVGKALSELQADRRPYIFTKCGLVWDPANRKAGPRQVGAPASIRREVEDSLSRLGIERIDLYQMHWPAEDGTPIEDYWRTLLDLK